MYPAPPLSPSSLYPSHTPDSLHFTPTLHNFCLPIAPPPAPTCTSVFITTHNALLSFQLVTVELFELIRLWVFSSLVRELIGDLNIIHIVDHTKKQF